MVYPKEYLSTNKTSNVDALDYILEVETERANEANSKRAYYKTITIAVTAISVFYILGLIILTIRAYRKHDKEYKSDFKNEYNREIIEEYDVPIVEYIMDKNITSNAFSAQVMNLIYKKKISVEKDEKKKPGPGHMADRHVTGPWAAVSNLVRPRSGAAQAGRRRAGRKRPRLPVRDGPRPGASGRRSGWR